MSDVFKEIESDFKKAGVNKKFLDSLQEKMKSRWFNRRSFFVCTAVFICMGVNTLTALTDTRWIGFIWGTLGFALLFREVERQDLYDSVSRSHFIDTIEVAKKKLELK